MDAQIHEIRSLISTRDVEALLNKFKELVPEYFFPPAVAIQEESFVEGHSYQNPV